MINYPSHPYPHLHAQGGGNYPSPWASIKIALRGKLRNEEKRRNRVLERNNGRKAIFWKINLIILILNA